MLEAVWNVLLSLAPWLFLGAALAGVLHVLLPGDFVQRHLSGRFGVVKAVLLGVPLPLCSCGVIPAGLGLRKDGASEGASVGFLISTPQTGVDSVLVSAAFLGWPFALFKVGAATVTGLIGGWLTDGGRRDSPSIASAPKSCCASSEPAAPERSASAALRHGLSLLRTIWRWLAVGILVSAAISVFLPEAWLSSMAGHGATVALFVALLVSVPLYVCATASVPIAAALVAGGFPPGAALVFLMAGPATNVATLGAIHRTLGRRAFLVYLSTIVGGSLVLGWGFDFVLPTAGQASAAHAHGDGSVWASISAAALVGMLAWFSVEDLRGWLRTRTSKKTTPAPPASSCCSKARCEP